MNKKFFWILISEVIIAAIAVTVTAKLYGEDIGFLGGLATGALGLTSLIVHIGIACMDEDGEF